MDCCPRNQRLVWGAFLLVLAVGWSLSLLDVITVPFWQFAGPLGLLFAAVSLLWPAPRTT